LTISIIPHPYMLLQMVCKQFFGRRPFPPINQAWSRANQLTAESRRNRVSALEAVRMGVQVQLFHRSGAAYSIMLLVTRHNKWGVHPMTYITVDGFIPFRFLLALGASHSHISHLLEAKDWWNAMEIGCHYPAPRLELRRGGTDEEALLGSLHRQTFVFPTSGGEVVAGISLNPAASSWDGCSPGSSSSSASAQASSQPMAARGSVRAMPGGDVPVTDLGADPSGARPTVMCRWKGCRC
jgi:hypothetical protein